MGETAPLTSPPLRVVFDTNIVVSALIFGRQLAWLRILWMTGGVTPLICRETTAELLRVLSYPKFKLNPMDREILLAEYLPYAEAVRLPDPLPAMPVACRDRNDVAFIQLALAAKADFLVSGDSDLTELREGAPIAIMAVKDLKSMLKLE